MFRTLTAITIAAAAITGTAATAHAADPIVGFYWALPDGTYLTDHNGHTTTAPTLDAGTYAICFTITNYNTDARYSVTTGELPPNADWTWRWNDIQQRIADGRFDQAKDFSYSFNQAETTNRNGAVVPGVLNECDVFKGVKPADIPADLPHDGGQFDTSTIPAPSPKPTPKPTPKPKQRMVTRVVQVDRATLTGNKTINAYLKLDDDRKLYFREGATVTRMRGFKERHEFVTVQVPAGYSQAQLMAAVNRKSTIGDITTTKVAGPSKASKLSITYAWDATNSWRDSRGGKPQILIGRS